MRQKAAKGNHQAADTNTRSGEGAVQTARADKWLWAARIFKTRSIAADACKNGRITKDGITIKPSHLLKTGEVVSVKKPPITYSFRILKPIEQRVGAKLLPEIYENVTDPRDEPHQRFRRPRKRHRKANEERPPSHRCLHRPGTLRLRLRRC